MTTSDLISRPTWIVRAVVYIRQSCPQQVISHQESLRLQYDLRQRALACGWPESAIDVIDCDLGLTASTTPRAARIRRTGQPRHSRAGRDHIRL